MTHCIPFSFPFQDLATRKVEAQFSGGPITSDAGALLLRELEERFAFIQDFAKYFSDHRDPELIEHSVPDLLKQRIFGLCLGYEDLNDHDQLRHDPLLAVLVGKKDPEGKDRRHPRDRGKALAGKSTLNRLELTPIGAKSDSRYKKIVAHTDRMQDFLVDAFTRQYLLPPRDIVLDIDATNFPLHGHQLGRFFHGYYDEYCYLPLYIFCGDHPLLALLRPANIDACTGALKHLQRIVTRLRACWPGVPIILRGDSGFCREHLLRWCEANQVDYVIGLAKNARLVRALGEQLQQAKCAFEQTGQAARFFRDFTYRTKTSWSRERRVVGKAEHLVGGANPRFVVTSLPAERVEARTLYEETYCARGEAENRIKEQKLLFACRDSCTSMRANQIRVLLSTVAYVLHRALREYGLRGTDLSEARCDTIRLKLFKIGAVIKISVRRVLVELSQAYPFQNLFRQVWENLSALARIETEYASP